MIRDKILQHLNQMIYLRNVTYVRTSLNSSVMNDNVMHARRYIQSCCSLPRITTNKIIWWSSVLYWHWIQNNKQINNHDEDSNLPISQENEINNNNFVSIIKLHHITRRKRISNQWQLLFKQTKKKGISPNSSICKFSKRVVLRSNFICISKRSYG